MDLTLLCHVSGRVQGVGYRAWTRGEARALGLSGWVKNEPDGSVRAMVSGPEAAVRQMLRAMESGPDGARVTSVVTESGQAPANPGFEIRHG